jgi:peptidoglycan/xylan/chitin deacetylase (PgdA/CDA1 family)
MMVKSEPRLARFGRKVARHLRARVGNRPRPAILMYHRIADDSFDPWGTIVSPARFNEQLEWLTEKRTILPLTRFAELQRRNELPPDAIALTFDDGYACNAEVAAPLLEKLGIRGTIFLPVEWVERGEPYWWDEVQRIVFEHEGPSLRLGEREFRLGEKRPDDRIWKHAAPPLTPRQVAFSEIWQHLLSQAPSELEASIMELRRQFRGSSESRPLPGPITRDQIRRVGANFDFGSHTLNHPDLTSLDRRARKREIVESIDRCEALTGTRPTSFAYPYGIFDAESENLVSEAGYECACSTETAAVGESSRIFALPRLQVGNWPARKLKLALALL